MTAHRWRALGLAIAIAVALALLLWDPGAQRSLVDVSPVPTAPDAGTPAPPRIDEPPRMTPAPPTVCRPRAHKACHDGDVYWFDSCGQPSVEAESCSGRGCNGISCQPPAARASGCGTVTEYGVCVAEIAQVCIGDRVVSIDCEAKGGRCAMTSEGAACLPRNDKHGCTGREPALCDGNHLRRCVDGLWAELDCGARKAVCSGGAQAHCEAVQPSLLTLQPVEVCDGHDNDLDGRVDEDGVCDAVPLVAFVPAGAKLLNLEARMDEELAILNRVFEPTKFRWAKTDQVAARYRSFDPADLESAARAMSQAWSRFYLARQAAQGQLAADSGGFDFYVPVLFSEKLKLDPPKAGLSTLPNSRCGGVRVSDQPAPPHGLIVLTEARQPETLAHEMGHYLGLCHTHEELAHFALATSNSLTCQISGDGICDTADDPGPDRCLRPERCTVECSEPPAHPDPFNIMSYYIGCRRALSAEQISEAERNLSLRRAWFRCLDPRDCPCDPAGAIGCPGEMSCHPGESEAAAWSCELDGPAVPGAACRQTSQCSAQAFCVGPASSPGDKSGYRCVRPCRPGPDCTCADVGLRFQVCAQDFRGG
jgi:Pregnancy-associated plasma protein-A